MFVQVPPFKHGMKSQAANLIITARVNLNEAYQVKTSGETLDGRVTDKTVNSTLQRQQNLRNMF